MQNENHDERLLEAADRLLRYYLDMDTAMHDVSLVLLDYMSIAAYAGADAYSEAEGVLRAYLEPGVPLGHFQATLGQVITRLKTLLGY